MRSVVVNVKEHAEIGFLHIRWWKRRCNWIRSIEKMHLTRDCCPNFLIIIKYKKSNRR